MKLSAIFDVFSRREKEASPFTYSISRELRTKVILFCQETFSEGSPGRGGADYSAEFWQEIHRFLQYRHGRFKLVPAQFVEGPAEDTRLVAE